MTSACQRHAFSAMPCLVFVTIVAIASNKVMLSAEPTEMTVRYVIIVLETKNLQGETHELTAHVSEKDLQEFGLTPALARLELDKLFDAIGNGVAETIGEMAASILCDREKSGIDVAKRKTEVAPLDSRVKKLLARGVLLEARVSKEGKLFKLERQLLQIPDSVEMRAPVKPGQRNDSKRSND